MRFLAFFAYAKLTKKLVGISQTLNKLLLIIERTLSMKYEQFERSFIIRLTKDDNQIFEEKFKRSGLNSRSEYIRELIRFGFTYTVEYSHIQEANMQLSKIGTNINQIAKKVNENQPLLASDITLLKEYMEMIWQLQKSTLSQEPLVNR